MLYMLGVVAASLAAGLWGGLAASALSFIGLNVFFTPPLHTFRVQKSEDFVALIAFGLVAGSVAALLTRARDEQTRAERRERETWHLYQVASRLLGGERVDRALDQFANSLVELFDLERCEVYTLNSGRNRLAAAAGSPLARGSARKPLVFALNTERGPLGELRIYLRDASPFGESDRTLVETFAAQVALAVEGTRLDSERRLAQAEAEASRIRAALFSSVTHDLRTPLASIKASATSLLDEGVRFESKEREELLTTIVEESDRLNRLIGNLLDLSRLRAGALVPEKSPTAIEDVIESVVARLRPLTAGRQVRIRVREGIPDVPMDVLQIDQVLTNLLENALRYSPATSEIEVSAAQWQSWAEVKVADHGSGIPSDERSKVFQEFYRREVAGTPGGTGLGLAIARAIVIAHAGEIWIQDTPGGGTTVTFRLPLANQSE